MVRERMSGMPEPRLDLVIPSRMPDDCGYPNPRASRKKAAPVPIETPCEPERR